MLIPPHFPPFYFPVGFFPTGGSGDGLPAGAAADNFRPELLRQRGIYWPPTGGTNDDGSAAYGTPTLIACRYTRGGTLPLAGEAELLAGTDAYIVDRDVEEEGVLVSPVPDPVPDRPFGSEGGKTVRRFRKVPAVRADTFVRRAWVDQGKR